MGGGQGAKIAVEGTQQPERLLLRLWWEPRSCGASFRQRYSISSSTTYTTIRPHSKYVASSTNHGSHVHGGTFSLVSSSDTSNPFQHPMSNCGRRPSRILPTLPHTTRLVSLFVAFQPSPLRIQMWVVGFAPFMVSYTCAWSATAGRLTRPLSSHSTDYRLPSDHSI